MAAINVVIFPANLPPPPQAVAPAVRVSRVAVAAADAVVCLWFASAWCLFAGIACTSIGRLTCGLNCAEVNAAGAVTLFSVLFCVIVCPLAALLLSIFVGRFYYRELTRGAEALEPVGKAAKYSQIIAILAFLFVEAIALLLDSYAADESPMHRITSKMIELPLLGITLMCSLVTIPGSAVRMWRMRRPGSASVVPTIGHGNGMVLQAAN